MPECFVVLRSSRLPIPALMHLTVCINVRQNRKHQESSPGKSDDLRGNAPRPRGSAALLLIDVINDMDFPKNEHLVRKSGASCPAYRCFETTLQKGGDPDHLRQRQQ